MDQQVRSGLPTGIVTFLFTDIEGSTRLLSHLGDDYPELLEDHARILRDAIGRHDGVEVNTEGDAFFAVFTTPASGLAAAAAAQSGLAAHDWPRDVSVRVRMGVHSGEGKLGGDDYVGIDVHRAARIASAAHGGQVLLSEATRALVGESLPGISLRDLGSHELKDLDEPERIYQLVVDGLPDVFPPPRARRLGNIPEQRTSFVGREAEVAAIEQLLTESRLVTVTGPGGAGKTRLSLQVASELGDRLSDGAFFVALDTVREPDLFASTVAAALELTAGDDGPMATLTAYVADRDMLLVLDNLEQITSAAHLVDELVDGSPGLRVLATSRIPLGLYGELEFPAPPMQTPDASAHLSAEQLLDYESIALFESRARAVKPSFRIDERNAAAVVELVARLDGLPLAIELAAPRIRLLTPAAILERLDKRLDLLGSTARNLPDRQRTLRGAIDWSYDLLEPAEQHVFDRLGVFAGRFDIETVERIVDPGRDCGIDVLDALGSLVEKSLLVRADHHEEPSFSLLETMREYARERLEARGEDALLHERLANDVLELVKAAAPHLYQADDLGWYEVLDARQDDIRGALRWAIASSAPGLARSIAGSVWRYWMRSGLLTEGLWWTNETLEMADGAPAHRAEALIARGSLRYWQMDYAGAEAAYREARETYRSLDDEAGEAFAAYNLAFALYNLDDPDYSQIIPLVEQALAKARDDDDPTMTQATLFFVSTLAHAAGDLDTAEQRLLEAGELDAGDVRPLIGLARIALDRGDFGKARRLMLRQVESVSEMTDVTMRIIQLEAFAMLEVADGDMIRGMRLQGAAGQLRDDIAGGPPYDRAIVEDPVSKARAAIGDEAVDTALAEGHALDVDEAMSLAIGSAEAGLR